jgi:hypothetical protein
MHRENEDRAHEDEKDIDTHSSAPQLITRDEKMRRFGGTQSFNLHAMEARRGETWRRGGFPASRGGLLPTC